MLDIRRSVGRSNPAQARRQAAWLSTRATLNFGTVGAGADATATVTLTGVQPGQRCEAQEPADLHADLVLRRAYCDTPHVVTVTVRNDGGGAVTDTPLEWTISAQRGSA